MSLRASASTAGIAERVNGIPAVILQRLMRAIVAGAVVLASAPLMASPESAQETDSRRTISALLDRATEARLAGNHRDALAAYQQAAAALNDDPAAQDALGLLVRADLQRDIARMMSSTGSGDPCAALSAGSAYLELAGEKAAEPGTGDMLDTVKQQIEADRRRTGCTPSAPSVDNGRADATLVGHYYLSGVMETGSELRLKADGRFDWYISYGAVDQVNRGRWARVGQTVTLAADIPPSDTPIVRADQSMPWSEEAERRFRTAEWSRQAQLIMERCPWGLGIAAASSPYLQVDRPPASPAELEKAAKATRTARTARDAASLAVAKAASPDASDADRAAADAAMSHWASASHAMQEAHRAAGQTPPDIGSPAVPPACQYPAQDDRAGVPPEQWRRGVAVLIGDPVRELRLSHVGVTFVFSDGHRVSAETSRGGWAFAPLRKGTTVNELILALPGSDSSPATLPISPLAQGVQAVVVDAQQLAGPSLMPMRLRVEGRDLIPQGMPGGRYSRD